MTSDALCAGYRDDNIGRRLTTLADQLENRLEHAVTLRRDEPFNGSWWLTPPTPNRSV